MKKTTYIALLVNEDNSSVVKFSDFKSVEDFKKFLQDNHLTYDAGEGNFISTDDENLEKIFNDLKMIDGVEIEIEFREGYTFGPEAKYYK